MIAKITVLYRADTFNVLAAVSRSAAPPGTADFKVDQLAKPWLLVRKWENDDPTKQETLFHVPQSALASDFVDVDDTVKAVQGNPRDFMLDDGKLKQLASSEIHDVVLATDKVTVELIDGAGGGNTPVAEAIPVRVQIEGGVIPEDDPLILEGMVEPPPSPPSGPPPDGKKVEIEISPPLGPGNYRMLVFARTYPLKFESKSLP